MKLIRFLIVALLALSLGCAPSWLSSSEPNSIVPPIHLELEVAKKAPLDGIEATMRACGNGYAQAYELPDGKKLGEGNDCYGSYREAKREMNILLNQADQIIEKVAPSKQTSELRSNRVVASFPKDEFGNAWVRIMWVQGECIHSINAPDIENALEFEKSQFNPYKFEE